MTDRALQLYNSNRVYYSLERDISGSGGAPSPLTTSANGEMNLELDSSFDDGNNGDGTVAPAHIDNPDQRITEDVRLNHNELLLAIP